MPPLTFDALSTLFEPLTYEFIDPYEIQCFPPREVDEAMEKTGVEYPDLLEAIAGLLQTRSPRFAQDLCPFLESYMHEHNFSQPLAPADEERLRAMLLNPETVEVAQFARLVPNVLLKACTLATETFVQNRPGWVLKALPQLNTIKRVMAN
jgi:hypothetical protein